MGDFYSGTLKKECTVLQVRSLIVARKGERQAGRRDDGENRSDPRILLLLPWQARRDEPIRA